MSLFTTGIIEEFLTTHQNGRYVFQFVLSATGAGTFTVPAGVTQIDVGCWGGGGAGGGNTNAGSAGYQGGGGGGYAWSSLTGLTPGTQYSYFVGAGGIGFESSPTSGGTTYFGPLGCNISTCTIRAMGGGRGNITDSGGGGGNPSWTLWANIGQVTYYGGNGATGTVSGTRKTGGGGSGAGSTQVGNFGSQSDGAGGWGYGGAAAPTLGGKGGDGYWVDPVIVNGKTYGNGLPGSNYGGGGGGAARLGSTVGEPAVNGGDGAQGLIVINCIIP